MPPAGAFEAHAIPSSPRAQLLAPLIGLLVSAAGSTVAMATPASVFVDELTWTELRDALKSGSTTVIIPVGGTEQSGPHIALGKHNVRVKALAGRIATALGQALVAPVVAYVPEGAVSPPAGHMRFAGTISVADDAFKGVLDGAARSFRQHGFIDVVLLGDHGGYQPLLKAVAAKLNRDWAAAAPPGPSAVSPVATRRPAAHAHFIAAYYELAQTTYVDALRARGFSDAQIGSHAGLADTSLTLAVDASLVRPDRLPKNATEGAPLGVAGDPRGSTAALGQLGTDAIVTGSVAAIRSAIRAAVADAPRH